MKFFLLIVLLFLFSSCMTLSTYHVDVLCPAEVTISPLIKSVVLVDNSISSSDSLNVFLKTPDFQASQLVSGFVDTLSSFAVKEAAKELRQRKFFDTVYVDVKSLKDSTSFMKKRLSDTYLSELKKKYNADALILMNGISFKTELNYEYVSSYSVYLFEVEQIISGNTSWEILDLTADTIIDRFKQSDILSWKSYSDSLVYPVNGIPLIFNALGDFAGRLGYYYADRTTPFWQSIDRLYFSSDNGEFNIAKNYVLKGDWVKAEKVWYYIYEKSKGLKKARAAYNIALAKEIQNDIESAGKWAFESYSISKDLNKNSDLVIMANAYYDDLVKRFLDNEKLFWQLGGN